MKKTLKNVFAFALVLSLALSISAVPAEAKAIKGVVAPQTTIANDGGGVSSVSSWNEPDIFSSQFNSYKVSADVYLPSSLFSKDGGMIFIDPQIQFWFPELEVNAFLESDNSICVGYDYENNCPFFEGLVKGSDAKAELPYVKEVVAVDDMIKVEIVDAPVNSTMKKDDFDPNTGSFKPWTEAIPTKGDAVAQIKVGTDRPCKLKFAVTNASVKIGDKEYKTDYSKSDDIAGFNDDTGEYSSLKASTFNTTAVTVAKASVSVKKKKSVSVKVTTMFSGDKVTVSSSSAKVAKASYKGGKVTIKGVKKGKATVSVKANGKTKTIKVTVK